MVTGELRMVSIGDSVAWGQGLRDKEKYDVLVGDTLRRHYSKVTLQRLAHSGAVIGAFSASGPIAKGEVPVARPTLLEQCESFSDSPEKVRLVLLSGGIHDIDIRTILNPLVPRAVLSAKTRAFCGQSMAELLERAKARFKHPHCRIIVTGYYIIWSHHSEIGKLGDFLRIHGIAQPSFIEDQWMGSAVAERCRQFYEESTFCILKAVRDTGDPRIVFVDSGFTEDNAVFSSHTYLFGLNDDFGLSPEDPMAAERHASCDATFDRLHILEREQCYRASAGHPNLAGAQQYAHRILGMLETLGLTG
ncbi:MAG: hypothetical protein PHX83_03480 [Acidobacteriia bacterium]|nr:hypothetical protein [Terriglobia bacterium]